MAGLFCAALATALSLFVAEAQVDTSQLGFDVTAQLKPEYIDQVAPLLGNSPNASGQNYVFLQRFPLGSPDGKSPIELFYHTEVLVCPAAGFSQEDKSFLEQQIKGMTNFAEIPEAWWQSKTAACVELGYGGAPCVKECCAVGHRSMALSARQAVISNADVTKKRVYIYGESAIDGDVAWHDACDHKCWSNWAGINYNILTNNCNTFTSTLLSCVYGLSQKKPSLGVSDMVTVHGHCPASSAAIAVTELLI